MNNVIYVFRGLGSTVADFENLNLGPSVVIIDYPKFDPRLGIDAYIKTLASLITAANFSFIGFSIGGSLALEVAKYKKPQTILLISSIISRQEMSLIFRLFVRLRLNKQILLTILTLSSPFLRSPVRRIARQKLVNINKDFLDLVYYFLSSWPGAEIPGELIRIHGRRDVIFPLRKVISCQYVVAGGHFLLNRYSSDVERIVGHHLLKQPQSD